MGVTSVSVEAAGPPSGASGAAQPPQNRVPDGLSKAHREHFILEIPEICLPVCFGG